MPARTEVILFDFFGTLVEYQPDRTRLGSPRSSELVASWGSELSADEFVLEFDAATAGLEAETAASHAEFSMFDAAAAFATRVGLVLDDARTAALADAYLAEWSAHVRPVEGAAAMVARLADRHRLGIVSNTHDESMIPTMLAAMGVADRFEMVLLSIGHGLRKPHPSIYRAAMEQMSCAADAVVFVGDSYDADYAGPQRAGMHTLLIDPDHRHGVAAAHRLDSVLDVERALGAHRGAASSGVEGPRP